jgi:hypothetical protein
MAEVEKSEKITGFGERVNHSSGGGTKVRRFSGELPLPMLKGTYSRVHRV